MTGRSRRPIEGALAFAKARPAPPAADKSAGRATDAAGGAGHPYAAEIEAAARRTNIPAHWIAAVMRVESANRADAVSPAGAGGLMQIMPGTWEYLRGRYGLGADRFEPADNVLAGALYMAEMYERYDGDRRAMLGAYNAGPGRMDEHLRDGRELPVETRRYIDAILPELG